MSLRSILNNFLTAIEIEKNLHELKPSFERTIKKKIRF